MQHHKMHALAWKHHHAVLKLLKATTEQHSAHSCTAGRCKRAAERLSSEMPA
jgi:hypothetical protein